MSFPSGFETMMRQAVLDALATEEVQQAVADAGADVAEATEAIVSHPTLGEGSISLQPTTEAPVPEEPVVTEPAAEAPAEPVATEPT